MKQYKIHAKSLVELIEEFVPDPKFGAEIGVWFGRTSRRLLMTFPNLQLIMVDSYYEEAWFKPEREFSMRGAMGEAFDATAEFASRRSFIIDSSTTAARFIYPGTLDFVFIDAGHKYNEVCSDLYAWCPKVRSGGLVAGHDYGTINDNRRKYGVKMAVDEWVATKNVALKLSPGYVWSFINP